MKTAKEMFEALGYSECDADVIPTYISPLIPMMVYVTDYNVHETIAYIIFYKSGRVLKWSKDYERPMLIATGEIKAIHQQMIELGWLDE